MRRWFQYRVRLWMVFPAVFTVLFVAFVIYDWRCPVDLQSRSLSQTVLAADGSPLRNFADSQGIWRFPVSQAQVAENYLEALIAYEDQYFYIHPGVNPWALLRAGWQWLSSGHIVSGGSTLTMQVARIRNPQPRTIKGKLVQIIQALQLEWHYSKADILHYYLNHAPFGGTFEGVQAASFGYFGHSAAQLTDAQAALLAVLPQAPSYYRPTRHPERAQQARDKLMLRLVEQNRWSKQRADDAMLEDIDGFERHSYQLAPLLSRRLVNNDPSEQIHSFIQPQWQRQIEDMIRQYVQTIGQQVSAAALVVENNTGKVRVYAGSADFNDASRFAYVDMVRATRSPGSTLKPFIYGMAIDQGLIHSHSLLMDVPLRFGDYQPENFSGGFSGPVSTTEALQKSLNIPAVQVLERLKPIYFFLQMKQAGIHLALPGNARPNLAVALGGVGSSLQDLVYAYTSLANGGQAQRLRYSKTDPEQHTPLLSAGAAWIIRKILLDNPGAPAGLAVKTGTSYGFRDAWAIGVSQHYTLGVWVGRPDSTPMPGHYGQVTAVPLLDRIYQHLNDQRPEPEMPDQVTVTEICWPQGKWVQTGCDEQYRAYVLDKTLPTTWYSTAAMARPFQGADFTFWQAKDSGLRVSLDCDIEAEFQRVSVWPAPLEPWLDKSKHRDSRIPLWDSRCTSTGDIIQQSVIKILGLDNNDAFQLEQNQQTDISVSIEGGEEPFYWFLNGALLTGETRKITLPNLASGQYQLLSSDQAGATDRVEFSVLRY